MEINKELLQQKLTMLEQQLKQLEHNANAVDGGIQIVKHLMQVLEQKVVEAVENK